MHPGFPTLRLASHHAFYFHFSSGFFSFSDQIGIVLSCLNPCLSQTLFFLSFLVLGRDASLWVFFQTPQGLAARVLPDRPRGLVRWAGFCVGAVGVPGDHVEFVVEAGHVKWQVCTDVVVCRLFS